MKRSLCHNNRTFRTTPSKRLFGPRGLRLFVDYLDLKPGFTGRIDFIHAINITSLFEVKCSAQEEFITAETVWCPDSLTMTFENGRVRVEEKKYITRDDCAVSHQEWGNKTDFPMELTLSAEAEKCTTTQQKDNRYVMETPMTPYDFSVISVVGTTINLEETSLILAPGETVSFTVIAATGNGVTEKREEIQKKLGK